jgi:hypothetical protein
MNNTVTTPANRAAVSDNELLRRYEPILRFTKGELYFPTDIDRYVASCSLWVSHPDGREEQLLAEGEVTPELLAAPRQFENGAVLFLRFVSPPSLAQVTQSALKGNNLEGRARMRGWQPGVGRLARVGMFSRLIDALFTLTLFARGKVPGAVAAIAEEQARKIQGDTPRYCYYSRVVRDSGWIALQYWYFYHYDDWRTSFEGVNDHEADWETISVFLYQDDDGAYKPRWAVFSCHDFTGNDLRRRWDDRAELELVGDHPVAYVGAGSHAHYYRPGEYMIESEIPPLKRITPFITVLRRLWSKILRTGEAISSEENLLAIPFVEYARGDGLSIGPGQAAEWEAIVLEPPPDWLTQYRGLWGLYARDPIGGENAPAGPMFNRDGTPRSSWYDLLGYAGLDSVPPPPLRIPRLTQERDELLAQQSELLENIELKMQALQDLGVKRQAMTGFPNLRRDALELDKQILAHGSEIKALRRTHAQNENILDALNNRIAHLQAGQDDPPQAHINIKQEPTTPENMRFERVTEAWAALSIGLLMVGFVLLILFYPSAILGGAVILVVIFMLLEAIFRGRFPDAVRNITIALAVTVALILVYTYFWQIIIGALLVGGAYLTYENVRDLLSARQVQ